MMKLKNDVLERTKPCKLLQSGKINHLQYDLQQCRNISNFQKHRRQNFLKFRLEMSLSD